MAQQPTDHRYYALWYTGGPKLHGHVHIHEDAAKALCGAKPRTDPSDAPELEQASCPKCRKAAGLPALG